VTNRGGGSSVKGVDLNHIKTPNRSRHLERDIEPEMGETWARFRFQIWGGGRSHCQNHTSSTNPTMLFNTTTTKCHLQKRRMTFVIRPTAFWLFSLFLQRWPSSECQELKQLSRCPPSRINPSSSPSSSSLPSFIFSQPSFPFPAKDTEGAPVAVLARNIWGARPYSERGSASL